MLLLLKSNRRFLMDQPHHRPASHSRDGLQKMILAACCSVHHRDCPAGYDPPRRPVEQRCLQMVPFAQLTRRPVRALQLLRLVSPP